MKPCDQTCPKCGAFPVNLVFHPEVTEKEAERNKKLSERTTAQMSLLSLSMALEFGWKSFPSPAYIACKCARCQHHWRTKPMDAEETK